jgi:putative membrane protein
MNRHMNVLPLTLAAALVVPALALAQTPASTAQPPTTGGKTAATGAKTSANADAAFMTSAATAGMAEVALGKLGVANATASEVKEFAQRMIDDHTKANEELKALAAQKNVTLPTDLDAKHKAVHDKLAKAKGAAFDTAYMSQMVSDHQAAVTLFERESKSGQDAETKAWAAKTLPTLQQHQTMAKQIHSKAGQNPK